MVDAGPARDDDAPLGPDGLPAPGEVRSLYVDPSVQGGGLGTALLAGRRGRAGGPRGAPSWCCGSSRATPRARRFYERRGWVADGGRKVTPVADEELAEVRYRWSQG